MNINDLHKLGLLKRTLKNDIYVDLGDVITSDEFNSPDKSTNYRERAIKRLIKLELGFTSNINIIYELMPQIITINCVYCGKQMKVNGGGGNSSTETIEYKCPNCKARISLTLGHDSITIGEKP